MVRIDAAALMNNSYTKAGNPYKNTHGAGKKLGTMAGLGVGSYLLVTSAKAITTVGGKLGQTLKGLFKTFPTNFSLLKHIGKYGLIGLAAGAVTDFIVNSARRRKADKAAE